jgi:hypothetical protein
MFSIPIFSIETYIESPTSYDFGVGLIYFFKDDPALLELSMNNYLDFHS